MTDFVYEAAVALDPSQGGALVRSATGAIYATTDASLSTPLTVRGAAGEAKTAIVSSSQGVIESFIVEDHSEVIWSSGPYAIVLSSTTGIKAQAAAAAESALLSEQGVADALTRAFKIGRPGVSVPTYWGKFTSSDEPTAAEGAVEGDLGVRI